MVLEEVVTGAVVNASTYIPLELEPVVGAVRGFFVIASTLLGGLFGLYFIFMLLKFFYDRRILKEVLTLKSKINIIEAKLDTEKIRLRRSPASAKHKQSNFRVIKNTSRASARGVFDKLKRKR